MQQPKQVVTYLFDIADAAKAILEHTSGITKFEHFIENRLVYRAVERELTIIAEAINKIKKEEEEIILQHSKQIVGLRNRIVHGYAHTNHEIVWGVVMNHIKPLITEVELLINQYEN